MNPSWLRSLIAVAFVALVGCGDDKTDATPDGGGSGGGSGSSGSGGTSGSGGSGGASGSGGSSGTAGSGGTGGGAGTACGGVAIPMGNGGESGGVIGEWTDVTPDEVSLTQSDFNGDNYGVQDVLVDPVRPSDLYAFVCHQGVFKSVDYGQTWTKINTGTNGDMIDSGKPWGEGIDSNRCRDPETPPTLYSLGSQGGFWRSDDGGVSWERFDLPEDDKPRPQDGYDVDVDPYDGAHLLVGFHEETGLAESFDRGATWHSITLDPGMSAGVSWYVFFMDTGVADTTAETWLMIPQADDSTGTWRTDDGGETWTRVEGNEHQHGQSQVHQSNGFVYMAGVYGDDGWGVYRSTDFGATWSHQGNGGSQSVVYGTANYVYAQASGAVGQGTVDQSQSERAPQPGTDWSNWTEPMMSNGPKRAAVTYDGAHYIVVGGNWNAGLWRYVEP